MGVLPNLSPSSINDEYAMRARDYIEENELESHASDASPVLMGDAFTRAIQNDRFLVRHAGTFTDYQVGYHRDSWEHT